MLREKLKMPNKTSNKVLKMQNKVSKRQQDMKVLIYSKPSKTSLKALRT